MDVTEEGRACLEAIRHGREAWSEATALEAAGHSPATLEALEADGLVERWPLAEPGEVWTLSPFAAAELLGVRLEERLEFHQGDVVEVPYWVELGRPEWPVRLPRSGQEFCSLAVEKAVDPSPPVDEVLLDDFSGEPITLFAGDDAPRIDGHLRGGLGSAPLRDSLFGGIPIERDKRALRKTSPQPPPATKRNRNGVPPTDREKPRPRDGSPTRNPRDQHARSSR